jgi:hypothetical protein
MFLKPNKTLTFRFPSQYKIPEQSRIFVRTTSYSDGNCFFHSLLRAIDSKYRKHIEYQEALNLVLKFKEDIAEWVTFDKLKELGSGEQYRILFLEELNKLFHQDYHSENIEKIYQEIINHILKPHIIEKEILPVVLHSQTENFYVRFCKTASDYVQDKLKNNIDQKRLNLICSKVSDYYIEVFQQAHHNTLVNFKNRLRKDGEFTDAVQMECISQYVGYNFIFINEGNENEPDLYTGQAQLVSFDQSKKVLIFLWLNENHFEIIGELEPNKFISRIFDPEDKLIQDFLGYATSKSK